MEDLAGPRYRLAGADVDLTVDKLLFAGPDLARKRSAFWVLLVIAVGRDPHNAGTSTGGKLVPGSTTGDGVAFRVVTATTVTVIAATRGRLGSDGAEPLDPPVFR